MSGNRLLTAAAVLVALLGLTVWKWKAQESEDTRPAEVTVTLPKLDKNAIDTIEISVPGKTPVKLTKQDKAWRLSAPVSAPADQNAVETAITKLTELEVSGIAATKADNHKQLEVDDAQATHVVASGGGKALTDLLIGAYRSGNTVIRQKGAVVSATVKGSIKFAFDKDVKDWRDRTIVDASLDNAKDATFVNKNGTFKFVVVDGKWTQAPGEKPIADFDGEQVKSILGAAASLSATDFAPPELAPDAAGVGAAPVALVKITVGGDKPQDIELHIGNKQGDANYYLGRQGQEPVYVVTGFVGDRLQPSAEKFAKEKPAQPAAAPGAKPGAAAAKKPSAAKPAAAKPAK